jgi:hypothetical protein
MLTDDHDNLGNLSDLNERDSFIRNQKLSNDQLNNLNEFTIINES